MFYHEAYRGSAGHNVSERVDLPPVGPGQILIVTVTAWGQTCTGNNGGALTVRIEGSDNTSPGTTIYGPAKTDLQATAVRMFRITAGAGFVRSWAEGAGPHASENTDTLISFSVKAEYL